MIFWAIFWLIALIALILWRIIKTFEMEYTRMCEACFSHDHARCTHETPFRKQCLCARANHNEQAARHGFNHGRRS